MAEPNLYECLVYVTRIELYTTSVPLQKVKNSYQVTKFARAYTYLVPIVVLVVLVAGMRLKMMSASSLVDSLGPLGIFVGCLEICMSVLAYIVSNLSQQLRIRQHIELIDHLHKLDVMLVEKFNVKLNYQKMVRKNHIVIPVFAVYLIGMSVVVLVKIVKDDYISSMIIGFCYIYISIAPGISSYAAMNFAELLRVRFRLMQKLLRPEYLRKNYKDVRIRGRKIGVLIRCYRDMFKIVTKISDVYGVTLLVMHLHDFTLTTSQVYFIYWKSTGGDDNTELFTYFLFWMFPIVWKTFIMPLYMHLMLNDAEACIPGLSHADDHTPTEDVKAMVQTYTMWNRHNKTTLSVGGLIDSDLSLAFSMCCGIASYLLVLIQFKMQEDAA